MLNDSMEQRRQRIPYALRSLSNSLVSIFVLIAIAVEIYHSTFQRDTLVSVPLWWQVFTWISLILFTAIGGIITYYKLYDKKDSD
jgi:hypothetical protein